MVETMRTHPQSLWTCVWDHVDTRKQTWGHMKPSMWTHGFNARAHGCKHEDTWSQAWGATFMIMRTIGYNLEDDTQRCMCPHVFSVSVLMDVNVCPYAGNHKEDAGYLVSDPSPTMCPHAFKPCVLTLITLWRKPCGGRVWSAPSTLTLKP